MGTHFFTSITANYLPKARVLSHSIRQFHPTAIIHVVFSDIVPAWFDLAAEPFDHLITLDDLPIPNLRSWLFQHDLVELSTAVKGYALQRILARPDCEQVVYLDPDIVVLSSFDDLLGHFHDASILLTPHQLKPETQAPAIRDNELLALCHGIFNLGFLGVKNSPEGHRFAAWWTQRLHDFCFDDVPAGLFTDQRWADFIPAFFPDHKILRDPVYNVATWNLSHRRVEGSLDQGLTVDGRRIVFYHFSGLDSGSQLGMLQRYGSDMPALFALRRWYLEQCDRHGDRELNSLPWAYGCFASGEPILKAQRRRYRFSPALQARFPDPFQSFEATPAVSPAPPDEPLAPYRIFLIAAPGDELYLDETLSPLLRNTVNKDHLWLVARTIDREIQSIAVDATLYQDFVAHIVKTFADKDIVLIRAGALPPPQWDLRLAWTAARQPDALTVSPLDSRTLDLIAALDAEELDRRCYFYREPDELEVGASSPDCVYLKSPDVAPLRSRHLLATHLSLSFLCPLESMRVWPLRALRDKLRNHSPAHGFALPPTITSILHPATLHIAHSWDGASERWLRSFTEADSRHQHLVLKSVGPDGLFSGRLYLYRYGQGEPELLEAWSPLPPIRATAIAHQAYQRMLAELRHKYPVARVLVSSLLGHSLDCLRTGLPTALLCDDAPAGVPSELAAAIQENHVTRTVPASPDEFSADLYFSGPHAPEPLPGREFQLYWSEPGQPFSEHRTSAFAPFHSARQTARLYLPATENGVAQLRLDLGSKPGILSIHRVALFRSGDQKIWSVSDAQSLLTAANFQQLYPLSPTLLCLTGDDPQITFQLPAVVLDALSLGGYLDLDFAWHTIDSHTTALLALGESGFLAQQELSAFKLDTAERIARLNSEMAARLKTQQDRFLAEIEMARSHSDNLAAINHSLQASLSWKLTRPVRLLAKLGRRMTGGS